jgi:hypothetical protein
MASAFTAPSVTASGTTWAQLLASGLGGHLDLLINKQPQPGSPNLAPTVAATATATGGGATGGALAAGTYYFVVTETNGFGETTISPESLQLTVGATNIPRVTFQTLKTGNTARNLYFGAKNGPSGGPYTLYVRGVTAGTYDMALDLPTDSSAVAPPTVNTTALSTKQLELLKAARNGRLQDVYNHYHDTVTNFLDGNAVTQPSLIKHVMESGAVIAILNTLYSEVGTLIVANPGTFHNVATGIGGMKTVRQWP